MRILSMLLVFFAMISSGSAQLISNIDFDDIKEQTTDSNASYYHPDLVERILNHDTTLSRTDYKYLYYGTVFTTFYQPYGFGGGEKEMRDLINIDDYESAIPIGLSILRDNPISIKINYSMLYCYHMLNMKDSARLYGIKYYSLLRAIYDSGDGKSEQTAYVVVAANDEYQILSDLKLHSTKQALLKSMTDLLTIDTKNQTKVKGKKKIKALYFNVSQPMGFLSRSFKTD